MTDVVDILLRLRGARQFQSDADKSARSIGGIGKSAEKSGKQAATGWRGMAKWAAPAAAFAGTAAFIKSAVSSTEGLAKSTMALQRSTGLDTKTASEWATVTKARGIDTAKFQMSLTKLSRTLDAANQGSKTMGTTLDRMGISDAARQSGDLQQVLFEAADAYSAMENPAEKAALAQQLFGRQALAMAPMLNAGSEGLREQLGLADKYGATLDDKAVEGSKNLIAQQREMKIAFEGLKIQMGTALLPAIEAVVGVLAQLTRVMQPVLQNSVIMKALIGALVVVFITYRAAVIASTIASLGFNAALLLIPLAIVAIAVGLVMLYKKCAWFRNAVDAVWQGIKAGAEAVFGFIRDHWKALLTGLTGPMGLAVAMVIKHWDQIKAAVGAAVDWMLDKIRPLTDAVGKVSGFAGKVGGGALHALPGLATGGTIQRAGAAVVGERGPEIVTLPGGASVIPMPAVQGIGGAPSLDAGGAQTIVTQVFLDRRMIAEAIGSYVADRRARR